MVGTLGYRWFITSLLYMHQELSWSTDPQASSPNLIYNLTNARLQSSRNSVSAAVGATAVCRCVWVVRSRWGSLKVPFSNWHPSQGIRSNYYLLQILLGFCIASWNALKGVAGGSVNASECLKHSLNPFVTLRLRFELLETAAKGS